VGVRRGGLSPAAGQRWTGERLAPCQARGSRASALPPARPAARGSVPASSCPPCRMQCTCAPLLATQPNQGLGHALCRARRNMEEGDPLPEGAEPTGITQRITFMCNDWHTALLPALLQQRYKPWGVYTNASCVLSIHNLAHQGTYPLHVFNELGLDGSCFGLFEWIVPDDAARTRTVNIFKVRLLAGVACCCCRCWGAAAVRWCQHPGGRVMHVRSTDGMRKLSCMRAAAAQCSAQQLQRRSSCCVGDAQAGIMAADAIVTVSQAYAQEVLEEPQIARADMFLAERRQQFRGIVNGTDTSDWNPEMDKHLTHTYGPYEVAEGKAANKRELLRGLRMPDHDSDAPLVAFIGRLDYQKGPDIMLDVLPYLVNMDCKVIAGGASAAAA